MNLSEFKAEAKKQGFKLTIKKEPKPGRTAYENKNRYKLIPGKNTPVIAGLKRDNYIVNAPLKNIMDEMIRIRKSEKLRFKHQQKPKILKSKKTKK